MTHPIDARLAELGLTLPDSPAPAANYVPFVQTGNLLFVSGQVSMNADGLVKGRLGQDMDTAAGAEAAKLCGLALLAQARKACDGDWSRLKRVIKLTGFVNSAPEFGDQPQVINGCSDLLVEVLGEAGRHSRSAVSAGALPFGVAVEIEAIFELA